MKRSKFNLSHNHLLTMDMGGLYPISCVEALPGDTIQAHANVLMRVSPLAAPVMHPVTARVHHFFVPNRKLWDGTRTGDDVDSNWEDFITGGDDGLNADTPPTIGTVAWANTLLDYLGLAGGQGIQVNALPIRAINMIFNEYYRDQDLVAERALDDVSIPKIAWEKDYFSSARPWTQKGSDVTIPLGDRAPVLGIGTTSQSYVSSPQAVYESNGQENTYFNHQHIDQPDEYYVEQNTTTPGYPGIYADLANATGGNVNDVRRAFAIQRYQEARARYGSRYTEYLRYLGVANPRDARLQRPEYLGGGRTQINFSEIMQTAPETGVEPSTAFGVGDLYGHGIAAMRSNKFRRFIEEHGYIISMLSVRPKAIYQNGIHRGFLRKTKEDYFQKELQFIGQQEIYNSEVFAANDAGGGNEIFGYNDRYSEYRSHPSHVSGNFRHTLDYWHLARQFDEMPVLNESFIECNPSKRIYNEQTEHGLWCMVQNKMVARRVVSRSAASRIF